MSEDQTRKMTDNALLRQLVDLIHSLNGRVAGLEEKYEARFLETRPMSERIDQLIASVAETRAEVRQMSSRLERVENEVGGMSSRLERVENEVRGMNSRLERVENEFKEVKQLVHDIDRSLRRYQLDGLRRQEDFDERLSLVEERTLVKS